ncbi:MAG: HAMP domain-containing sensor histidine kinase [Sulfuricurvum sp.]
MLFSKRSIRQSFLVQLIFASASLVFIFSSFLYIFIEKSIINDKYIELIDYAKNIVHNDSLYGATTPTPEIYIGVDVEIIKLRTKKLEVDLYESTIGEKTILNVIYPYNIDELSYLKISKDITAAKALSKKILNYILIINIVGFLLIIVYAIGLSKMLIHPVITLSKKLSNMNEHLMKPLVVEELPEEFEPLGNTINHLLTRIQNFVKYQKELFIGTAHELKTPLAVIKLKNQVTLIKKRSDEEYIDAIKTTNKTIDEMNNIISSILNIGRQEGALLEKPVEVDLISILHKKASDFTLLAQSEGKHLRVDLKPDGYMAQLQVTLLNQVLQNFLQNALKFTPEGKSVLLRSYENGSGLMIEVIDEGCGIGEEIDLFAPFTREGDKGGAGLGLFLAKSAADALGATIEIKNRTDGVSGAIATLSLSSKLSCILPSV